jgi:hypothetical protein
MLIAAARYRFETRSHRYHGARYQFPNQVVATVCLLRAICTMFWFRTVNSIQVPKGLALLTGRPSCIAMRGILALHLPPYASRAQRSNQSRCPQRAVVPPASAPPPTAGQILSFLLHHLYSRLLRLWAVCARYTEAL